MTLLAVAVAATVILLFPMGFFLLSAPAFLLVPLDIPEVTQLLRGVFYAYFVMVTITSAIGALAFLAAGQWTSAVGLGLIAAISVMARRWFLQRLDSEISARDAGDAQAVRRLRGLHWQGMLSNALQLAVVLACIPHLTAM